MKKHVTDPVKAVLYFFSAIIFGTLSITAFAGKHAILSAVYGAAFLIYFGLSIYCCCMFSVDEKGVTRSFFGKVLVYIPWDKVREFGIANLKVIKNHNKNKIGEVYIYFSPSEMTDEKRLSMCLKWPPKNICYLRFSVSRLKDIQQFTEEKPILFWMTEEAYLDKFFR